jgi:hypothetical protein
MFCGDNLGEEMKLVKDKANVSCAKISASNTCVKNVVICIYFLDLYTECTL